MSVVGNYAVSGGDDKLVRVTDLRKGAYQSLGSHRARTIVFSIAASDEAIYVGCDEVITCGSTPFCQHAAVGGHVGRHAGDQTTRGTSHTHSHIISPSAPCLPHKPSAPCHPSLTSPAVRAPSRGKGDIRVFDFSAEANPENESGAGGFNAQQKAALAEALREAQGGGGARGRQRAGHAVGA